MAPARAGGEARKLLNCIINLWRPQNTDVEAEADVVVDADADGIDDVVRLGVLSWLLLSSSSPHRCRHTVIKEVKNLDPKSAFTVNPQEEG